MTQNLSFFFLCLIVTVGAEPTENVDEFLGKCKNFALVPVEKIEALTGTSTLNQNYVDSRRAKDLQTLNKVVKSLGGSKTVPFLISEDDPLESFLLQYLISLDQDIRTMYHDLKRTIRDRRIISDDEPKIPGRMCTLISNNLLLASQSYSIGEVTVVKLGLFPSWTTMQHLDLNCYLQEFKGPVEVQWKIENPPDHLLVYKISGFSEWNTETLEIGFSGSESSSLNKMRNGFDPFSSWTFSPEISFRLMSESVTRAKTLSIEWVAKKKSELKLLTEDHGEFEIRNSFSGSADSLEQEWAILATPPKNRIKLSLFDLNQQSCSNCKCNQLKISLDPNFEKDVKNLCWSLEDLAFDSVSSFLFLKAGSDGVQNGKGARISFSAFTAANLGTFSSNEVEELVVKNFLNHWEFERPVALTWTVKTDDRSLFIYEIDGLEDCNNETVEIRYKYQDRFFPVSNRCMNKNLLWSWTREDLEFRITSKDASSAKKITMNWTSLNRNEIENMLIYASGTIDNAFRKGFESNGVERKWLILAPPPRNRIHLQFPSDGNFIPSNCGDYSLKMSDLSGIENKTISFCEPSPPERSYISTSNILIFEYKPTHKRKSGDKIMIRYSSLTAVDIGRFTSSDSEKILFEKYMKDAEYPALVTWTVENLPNHLLYTEINGFSDCYKSTIQKRYVGGEFSSLNDDCKTDGQLASFTLEPVVSFKLIIEREFWTKNLSMQNTFLDKAGYNEHANTRNISTSNYPDGYEPKSIQKWIIFSNYTKSKISLTFHDFQVEDDPNCLHDSLKISTLPRQSDGEKVLCGFDLPSKISFNTNLLTLTFTSNDGKNGRGFHLSYNIQYEMGAVNLEEIPSHSRKIEFLDQLKDVYGPGTVAWTIENPRNKILIYYFNGLQNCYKENLEIRDGNLGIIPSMRSYCYDETSFVSWSNQSRIEFKLNLDDVQSERGFSLKWRIIGSEGFQIILSSSGHVDVQVPYYLHFHLIMATLPRNRIRVARNFSDAVCNEIHIKASYPLDFIKDATDMCEGDDALPYESITNFLLISYRGFNRRSSDTNIFSTTFETFIAEPPQDVEEAPPKAH